MGLYAIHKSQRTIYTSRRFHRERVPWVRVAQSACQRCYLRLMPLISAAIVLTEATATTRHIQATHTAGAQALRLH